MAEKKEFDWFGSYYANEALVKSVTKEIAARIKEKHGEEAANQAVAGIKDYMQKQAAYVLAVSEATGKPFTPTPDLFNPNTATDQGGNKLTAAQIEAIEAARKAASAARKASIKNPDGTTLALEAIMRDNAPISRTVDGESLEEIGAVDLIYNHGTALGQKMYAMQNAPLPDGMLALVQQNAAVENGATLKEGQQWSDKPGMPYHYDITPSAPNGGKISAISPEDKLGESFLVTGFKNTGDHVSVKTNATVYVNATEAMSGTTGRTVETKGTLIVSFTPEELARAEIKTGKTYPGMPGAYTEITLDGRRLFSPSTVELALVDKNGTITHQISAESATAALEDIKAENMRRALKASDKDTPMSQSTTPGGNGYGGYEGTLPRSPTTAARNLV